MSIYVSWYSFLKLNFAIIFLFNAKFKIKSYNNQIVPALDKIVAIFDYFEDKLKDKNKILSSNWYLTGKGPMFLTSESESLDSNIIRVKAPKGAKVLIEYED